MNKVSVYATAPAMNAVMLVPQRLSAQTRVVRVQERLHEYLTKKFSGKEDTGITQTTVSMFSKYEFHKIYLK
jgi:hypothetical protein